MRKTITPCLIQKKPDHFLVKFPEYPDCALKCENLEDCLNIAPTYLSAFMLYSEQEFVPHTKPLTPKTSNKDQLFTLLSCDMDEMENILEDFKVEAKEFINWLTGRCDEPKEVTSEKDINKNIEPEQTPAPVKEEPVLEMELDKVINIPEDIPDINDDIPVVQDEPEYTGEFEDLFGDVETKPSEMPVYTPEELKEMELEEEFTPINFEALLNGASEPVSPQEPSDEKQPEKIINKSEYRQRPNNKQVKQPEANKEVEPEPEKNINKEEPVSEQTEPSDEPKESGLKNKVQVLDYEKKNNSGIFEVIEEEELEFAHKAQNENKPSNAPNRQQQNFHKKKKYNNKKKKNNNYQNNKPKDNTDKKEDSDKKEDN